MTELTLETAKKLAGQTISLSGNNLEDPVTAKVSEIIENTANGTDWECFTLILDVGETPTEVTQGIYNFESSEYKNEHIFLSPNSFTECEIVVSRKVAKA